MRLHRALWTAEHSRVAGSAGADPPGEAAPALRATRKTAGVAPGLAGQWEAGGKGKDQTLTTATCWSVDRTAGALAAVWQHEVTWGVKGGRGDGTEEAGAPRGLQAPQASDRKKLPYLSPVLSCGAQTQSCPPPQVRWVSAPSLPAPGEAETTSLFAPGAPPPAPRAARRGPSGRPRPPVLQAQLGDAQGPLQAVQGVLQSGPVGEQLFRDQHQLLKLLVQLLLPEPDLLEPLFWGHTDRTGRHRPGPAASGAPTLG